MMSSKNRCAVFLMSLSLLTGALCYYLFCPDVLFVRALDRVLPFSFHVAADSFPAAFKVFRNYGLDFLWAAALSSCSVLFAEKRKHLFGLTASIVIFESVIELMQRSPSIPGTFDICDLLIECGANIIVLFIFYRRITA